ncbi:hypothetical protein [Verrucomicrobium sp. BvORR034]|uniref:hypothetical protein n=1 Tax=Verrucomicrobium sp. BvORR034 TaxID=1396418 RepID=UPI00067986BB|nr:hypothetical protein [Verrucomicrobium sp. BvORR034]
MKELDILFGLIGLAGYEALRLYKSFIARRALIPKRQMKVYLLIVGVLAVFAGACAYALANGNLANALFVGFSVPTGIRALLSPAPEAGRDRSVEGGKKSAKAPKTGADNNEVEVDDFDVEDSEDEPNREAAGSLESEAIKESRRQELSSNARGALREYFQ